MMATADHGGGTAAMGPSAAPPPGSAPALADGRARTSSGRFARTRSPGAPPSADGTSPGSTNADGRVDGAPRPPVAVQMPDAAALAAAAAARAADIDAASMHIFAALRAAPGPRRPTAHDTPSLKNTVEFAALCKLASSVEAKRKELHDMFPLLYEAVAERHEAPPVTPPPPAPPSRTSAPSCSPMLTTTLRLVEELGPALASWGERFPLGRDCCPNAHPVSQPAGDPGLWRDRRSARGAQGARGCGHVES